MVWVIFGIFVIIGLFVFQTIKTAALNNDPVQPELTRLILEMMANGATDDAQTIFQVSVASRLMTRMIDPKEWGTRLAHALSTVRPMLNEEGYAVARVIVRRVATQVR